MIRAVLFLALTLAAGCDFNSAGGSVVLEIRYPSGYVRDCYTWEEAVPVEGAQYRLRAERGEDFKETRKFDIQILDEDGRVIYEYPEFGFSIVRGELEEDQGDDRVWIVSENWNTPHYSGYVSGRLTGSVLFLVDMKTGDILVQKELEENELFLTCAGSRCYFYSCGQKGQEKFFGLWANPAEKARIYYRDQDGWEEEVTIYEFDYELEPEFEERASERRLRFSFEGMNIVVSKVSKMAADKNGKFGEPGEYPEISVPFGAE